MSYARMSGHSDVYVYASSAGMECCGCTLGAERSVRTADNAGMVAHLLEHRAAGHRVPERALERLRDPEDDAGNRDMWAEFGRKGRPRKEQG